MFKTSFGNFGPLIGVIYVGNTHVKFLVYSTKNAEVLTCHEAKLKQIVLNAGWLEFDPLEILRLTQDCIETAYRNLVILEINVQDLIAVSICTQRGTSVVWDRQTGSPLYNAIGWNDYRSATILKTLLSNVKGNVDYLKHRSGLTLSTCFCAFKIKWLLETVHAVGEAVKNGVCLFGSLESWILWNITGGQESGVHSTDVTNAAYTLLMNIQTLDWDPRLCNFFRIPIEILPSIRSNAEVFGFVINGPLSGLPIACCIGEQPATLLGQLCTKMGSIVCSIDESCFVLMNTGVEIVKSSHCLLTTVAYKLGAKESVCYALEGAIANAGSAVTWLKEGLGISTHVNENANVVETLTSVLGECSMISSSCSSSIFHTDGSLALNRSEITFVPAFHGLYSPYWRYDARGILLGLTDQTTSEHITQSAFEATGFQIHEVLEAFKRDTFSWDSSGSIKERLIVSGHFAEQNLFVQYITDILGCLVERPQTTSASCLGAMIVAGVSMKVITLQNAEQIYAPPVDAFMPSTTANRRELLYKRWDYAVKKCLSWNNYETYDADLELFAQRERDPNLPIRRSIPGSIFLTSTFVLLLVARFLHGRQ